MSDESVDDVNGGVREPHESASGGDYQGGTHQQEPYQGQVYQGQVYQGQYVYQQMVPVQPAFTPSNNTAMLVVSILAIVMCPFLSIWSFLESKKAKRTAEESGMKLDGMTTVTYVLSIIGLVYSALWLVGIVFYVIIFLIVLGTSSAVSIAAFAFL